MSKACIVGIGETAYARRGSTRDGNEFGLAVDAIRAAADDAGLPLREIDGFSAFAESSLEPAVLQQALGMKALNFSAAVWGGRGGGACGALALAAQAVQSGTARNVLVVRSICQGSGRRRYGQLDPTRVNTGFTAPFGLLSMPQMVGLFLQRYMHVYGVDATALGAVAIAFREHAQSNSRAVMCGRPLDLDQYLASRMIATPFRLPDCCLETDGACALIVSSGSQARDLRRPMVEILAAVQSTEAQWGAGQTTHNVPEPEYLTGNQRTLAARLYAAAGISAADVDVAQFYDAFTGMVLLALEDFGFCERGGAGEWVQRGGLRRDGGVLPSNTAGGSLSEAYVHGLNHVLEGVRQMRGESCCQVSGARVCLVTSAPLISPTSAALLAA